MLKEEVRIDDPASYIGRSFKYLISWSTKGPNEIVVRKMFSSQELKGGVTTVRRSTPIRDDSDLEQIARDIEKGLIKMEKRLRGKVEGRVLVGAFSLFQD